MFSPCPQQRLAQVQECALVGEKRASPIAGKRDFVSVTWNVVSSAAFSVNHVALLSTGISIIPLGAILKPPTAAWGCPDHSQIGRRTPPCFARGWHPSLCDIFAIEAYEPVKNAWVPSSSRQGRLGDASVILKWGKLHPLASQEGGTHLRVTSSRSKPMNLSKTPGCHPQAADGGLGMRPTASQGRIHPLASQEGGTPSQ